MRLKERSFVKHRGSRESGFVLRQQFLTARNKFDKLLRSTERSYKRGLMIDLENECTDNPKAFWTHLKNSGPKRMQSVSCEVYDADGNVCTDQNFVENTWTHDFSNLYNAQNEEFDHVFYDDMLQHKRLLENNKMIRCIQKIAA